MNLGAKHIHGLHRMTVEVSDIDVRIVTPNGTFSISVDNDGKTAVRTLFYGLSVKPVAGNAIAISEEK